MDNVQNYLIVQNNVVTNNVLWNGDTNTWMPPEDSIQLVGATTPAMVWAPVLADRVLVDWVLESQIGEGDIGFTWNGSVLTTPDLKPAIIIDMQPATSGTQLA